MRKNIVIIGSLVIIAFLFGRCSNTPQNIQSRVVNEPSVVESVEVSSEYTMEQFSRIKSRMTYKKVVSILGDEGKLISENNISGYHTEAYTWVNSNGSNLMLMFQNGKLIQKSQFGLT